MTEPESLIAQLRAEQDKLEKILDILTSGPATNVEWVDSQSHKYKAVFDLRTTCEAIDAIITLLEKKDLFELPF